jgi:hypothetical protein
VPGYAAVVSTEVLASNDYNLNIRRYADNTPPPELQDVRAHLFGGVPKVEVDEKLNLLATHGLPLEAIFIERDRSYYDFVSSLQQRHEIKMLIETHAAVQVQETRLCDAFNGWWKTHQYHLRSLPQTRSLMDLRADFLSSFDDALAPIGLLDRNKIAGVIARWWYDTLFDLKTIIADISSDAPLSLPRPARGFPGLIQSKVDTIISELQDDDEDNTEKNNKHTHALTNKLIVRLLPDYLRELAETEARIADLQQQREAFEHGEEAEDDSEETEENGENERNYAKELEDRLKDTRAALKEAEKLLQQAKRNSKSNGTAQYAQTLPLFAETVVEEPDVIQPLTIKVETLRQEVAQLDAQLQPYREIRASLSTAQQCLRKLKQVLVQRIKDAHAALTTQQCEDMVLDIAYDDIADELEHYLLAHRQLIIATIENWWDKYRITLQDIRSARDVAEQELVGLLKELGYAN